MGTDEAREFTSTSDAVFAMDPEPTLRELTRYLIANQKDIAQLERAAVTVRRFGPDDAETRKLLAEWDSIHRKWLTQTLPTLTAAMRLAVEVYDTFGAGMTSIDDPVEAGIWNNKYFVWERELSAAHAEPRRDAFGPAGGSI